VSAPTHPIVMCLMVAIGVLSLQDAYRAIDFDTITLLLGMMIVVANLRLSGFFRLVNGWVVTRARRPLVLLVAVVLVGRIILGFSRQRHDLPRYDTARPRHCHAAQA
jgi:Na+/H+ antiporter NhaD/arsenite permease-like protein